MDDLLLTLGVFIAFHLIPAIGPLRRGLIATVGKAPYIVGFSMMSLGLLGWVGIAYAEADTTIMWTQWPWTRWVPVLTMPIVCILLVGALTSPNALSVGVRAQAYDPAKPGIVSVTRHPLIWALILWALAHILPNGDTASLALFGLFAVLSLLGPKGVDARQRRQLGVQRWAELSGPTSNVPFLAIVQGRMKLDGRGIGWARIVGGLALYAALLSAHPHIIGVSPLP